MKRIKLWTGAPCCQCGEVANHGRCFYIGYQADWKECDKAPELIKELNNREKERVKNLNKRKGKLNG